MTKEDGNEPQLTTSWQLINPSIKLCWENIDSLLWLIVLPALTLALGLYLVDSILGGLNIDDTTQLRAISDALVDNTRSRTGLGILAASALWLVINYPATVILALRGAQGKEADTLSCYRESRPFFWRLIGMNIVRSLIVAGGLILLIVPGLIMLRKFYLSAYYITDQNQGIFDALRSSSRDTENVAGYVWGLIGVLAVFSLAGNAFSYVPGLGVALGGLFVYLYFFAPALRYQEIKRLKKA